MILFKINNTLSNNRNRKAHVISFVSRNMINNKSPILLLSTVCGQ